MFSRQPVQLRPQELFLSAVRPVSRCRAGSQIILGPGFTATGGSTTPTFLAVIGVPLTISAGSVTNGVLGTAYSASLSATGGTAPYSWSVTSGALPGGLGLSTGGVISGTPTAGGAFNFTVRVTDSMGNSGSLGALNIGILAITTTTPLPGGVDTQSYGPIAMVAVGGSGQYSWTGRGLTGGLMLTQAGSLSWSHPIAGTFNGMQITVTDTVTNLSVSKTFSVTIGDPPMVMTSYLPAGVVNQAYAFSLFAGGGAGGYTWSATGLPGWLSLSTGGALSGTPTSTAGSPFEIVFTAHDSSGDVSPGQSLELIVGTGLTSACSTVTCRDYIRLGSRLVAVENTSGHYYLTTVARAGGAILPASGSYNAGSMLTVTAYPDSGYEFSGFTGALTGVANPQTLTLNASATVTANFIVSTPPTVSSSVTTAPDSSTGANGVYTFTVTDAVTYTNIKYFGSSEKLVG